MPSKKKSTAITSLPRKALSAKKTAAVKGGQKASPGQGASTPKLAANHNQTLRSRLGR